MDLQPPVLPNDPRIPPLLTVLHELGAEEIGAQFREGIGTAVGLDLEAADETAAIAGGVTQVAAAMKWLPQGLTAGAGSAEVLDAEALVTGAVAGAAGLTSIVKAYGTNPLLSWRADAFPLYTLYRLESWAGVQFDAAVHLLREPTVALAAEVLLRGLIDGLVEVVSIVDGAEAGQASSAQCRALCYELEIVKKYERNSRDSPLSIMQENHRRSVERIRSVAKLIKATSCPDCPARGGKPWTMTWRLQALATRLDQPWLPVLWSEASMALHQTGLDRMMEGAVESQVSQLPLPASPSRRLTLLERLCITYAQTVHYVLLVDRPPAADLPLELLQLTLVAIQQLRRRLHFERPSENR